MAAKTPVLEKLEEIDAKLNVLVQESDPQKMDPKIEKVEKALEELRKEQAVTKNELQEMRRRTEVIQQNHQAIQALLAGHAGTEALQAVFDARRVDDQAYEEVMRKHLDATAAYQDELMARLMQAGQAGTEPRQAGTEARQARLDNPLAQTMTHMNSFGGYKQAGQVGIEARQAGTEALQAGTEARRVDDQTFEEVMRKHCDANAAWGADFMTRLWQAGQAGTEACQAGTEARRAATEARQQGGFVEALQDNELARMLALKRADQRRQARAEARQAEIEARQARTDNPLAQTMAHMNSFGGYKQAGQVGTDARQAGTEARQAETEARQADQAGKRRGGPGRPVGVKRDAKEGEEPKRKPVWPEAYGPSTFGEMPPSVVAYFKQQQEAFQKAQEAMLLGQALPTPLPNLQAHLAPAASSQVGETVAQCVARLQRTMGPSWAAPAPSPFLHDLFKAASVYKPLWEDHGLVKLPERTSAEEMAFKLATRVKELESQHMQDEETIASCRAKMDKNDTLKEENERLKAQLANFKDAFGIEEHKLQFDMDELKEKMVGAQVTDEPSTSNPAPRQESSDEDDFEKVQEDEEKEEEKMEEDA